MAFRTLIISAIWLSPKAPIFNSAISAGQKEEHLVLQAAYMGVFLL